MVSHLIERRVPSLIVPLFTWKALMLIFGIVSLTIETWIVSSYGDLSDIGLWLRYATLVVNNLAICAKMIMFGIQHSSVIPLDGIKAFVNHTVMVLFESSVITTFVNAPLIWRMESVDIDESSISSASEFWMDNGLLLTVLVFGFEVFLFGSHAFSMDHLPAIMVSSLAYFVAETINRVEFGVRVFGQIGVDIDILVLDLLVLLLWQVAMTSLLLYVSSIITSTRNNIQTRFAYKPLDNAPNF